MPTRRPLPSQLGQEPEVRPTRSPVDLYYRPNVGRVDQAMIYDLAPASRTLAAALRRRQEKKHEETEVAADRFVQENQELVLQIEQRAAKIEDPEERRRVYQETFDNLQKQGLIPAAADPFFQQLYARASARMMLGRYREGLIARLNEAAGTRGDDGSPALPPDIDAIIGQEWAKYADSPALQNFYGGQVAFPLKEQVDEEFRVSTARQRAQRIEGETKEMLRQDLAQRFDLALHANDEVTSETLQPITDFLTTEVRGHNVQNPRELVLEALELSFQRAAAVDVDEAVRAVYAAQELVVGGVKLGDDRSGVGLRLEGLKRRYLEQAEAHLQRQNSLVEQRRKAAILEAENEYVPVFLAAARDGANLAQVANELEEKFRQEAVESGRFDGQVAFVLEDMRKYQRATDAAQVSDGSTLDRFNVLMADGQVDDAETLLRAALADGTLTGADYAAARAQVTARRDVEPFMGNLYQTTKARYAQVAPSGFTPEVQQQIDDEVIDLQRRLERDYAAFVRTTAGEPDREAKHLAWLQEREATDLVTIRTRGKETRTARDELVRDVRGRFQRHLDSAELIARGEREGVLTVLEAQALREENVAAASREEFYRMREYGDVADQLDQLIQTEVVALGEATETDVIQLRRSAHQLLRDRFDSALDEVLTDERVDPRHFAARARVALSTIEKEIADELFPSQRAAIERGVREGRPAEETLAEVAVRREDLDRAAAWRATLRSPAGRETITPLDPRLPRHPAVGAEFYETSARWLSGIDPFFGSPTTRDDAQRAARQAIRSALADEALDDADRGEAIASVLSAVGVSADELIAGEAVLHATPTETEHARRAIERKRTALKAGLHLGSSRDRLRREIAELEALVDPAGLRVPLDGVPLRPYTTPLFRTEEELDAFVQDDARLRPLLERLGIDPDDERAVEDWGLAALTMVRLVNP